MLNPKPKQGAQSSKDSTHELEYAAYVTFSKPIEAAMAIMSIDGLSNSGGPKMHASLGTTKYCSFFLSGLKCQNVNCFYMHKLGRKSDELQKQDVYERNIFLHN